MHEYTEFLSVLKNVDQIQGVFKEFKEQHEPWCV